MSQTPTPSLDFYTLNLITLALIGAGLSYLQWKHQKRKAHPTFPHPQDFEARDFEAREGREGLLGNGAGADVKAADVRYATFKRRFLVVYLLVFGADWLQGPYIYPLYKDEKALPEATVAHLFTTGFLAAALSATFTGTLADTYGRRSACRIFCFTYAISCLTTLAPASSLPILFLGRILGGLSTTLMYSVFESWMVTEYHVQRLDEAGGSLNDIFGVMTTLNSVVAIAAGLVAQGVVGGTGTQMAPFLLAVGVLGAAGGLFRGIGLADYAFIWQAENYGESTDHQGTLSSSKLGHPEKNTLSLIRDDKRLWALIITTCFFEGSMYLWIFFKFPALRLAHQLNGKGSDLPFGMIFAALMCAMMLGSIFFTWYSALPPGKWVVPPSTLLSLSLMVAACCFLIPVLVRNEAITFWCFCVFEMCVGIYFPTMGNLKEKIVDDSVRAKVYGVLRVPLNVFVVVGLGMTKDGETHRDNMFRVCGTALIIAGVVVGRYLKD